LLVELKSVEDTSWLQLFIKNSRNPQVTATSRRFTGKPLHASRRPFSRSYGASLPSSLTRVLSRALEFSSRPPESVCGTDTIVRHAATFLGSLGSLRCAPYGAPHHVSRLTSSRLSLLRPTSSLYTLEPVNPRTGGAYPSPSSLRQFTTAVQEY